MCILAAAPGGRLGNQIYPWLYGLIYSKKWGLCLKNVPPEIKNFINFDFEYCPDCNPAGASFISCEADDFLEIAPTAHAYNFINYYIYGNWAEKYQDFIHETFNVKQHPDKEKVFMHIRLGDTAWTYKKPRTMYSFAQPFEYYQEAMDALGNPKGYISSDSPDHELVQKLMQEYDLELYSDGAIETIIFGAGFNNLILSGGTFSLVIGMISKADKIFRPGFACKNPLDVNGHGNVGNDSWIRFQWDYKEDGTAYRCS